jgi:hypothetical protein
VLHQRKVGKTIEISTAELLAGKKVIVFALPGAFTPTCSSSHVPRYNELAPPASTHAARRNGVRRGPRLAAPCLLLPRSDHDGGVAAEAYPPIVCWRVGTTRPQNFGAPRFSRSIARRRRWSCSHPHARSSATYGAMIAGCENQAPATAPTRVGSGGYQPAKPPVNLLVSVPTVVAMSSTMASRALGPEHRVDGKLDTAWNSETAELVGAWIGARIPAESRASPPSG